MLYYKVQGDRDISSTLLYIAIFLLLLVIVFMQQYCLLFLFRSSHATTALFILFLLLVLLLLFIPLSFRLFTGRWWEMFIMVAHIYGEHVHFYIVLVRGVRRCVCVYTDLKKQGVLTLMLTFFDPADQY